MRNLPDGRKKADAPKEAPARLAIGLARLRINPHLRQYLMGGIDQGVLCRCRCEERVGGDLHHIQLTDSGLLLDAKRYQIDQLADRLAARHLTAEQQA